MFIEVPPLPTAAAYFPWEQEGPRGLITPCRGPGALGAWELPCGLHVQAPIEEAAGHCCDVLSVPTLGMGQTSQSWLSLQNHSEPVWVQPCSRTPVFLKPSCLLWLWHAETSSSQFYMKLCISHTNAATMQLRSQRDDDLKFSFWRAHQKGNQSTKFTPSKPQNSSEEVPRHQSVEKPNFSSV